MWIQSDCYKIICSGSVINFDCGISAQIFNLQGQLKLVFCDDGIAFGYCYMFYFVLN